jgi:hypothetical protein
LICRAQCPGSDSVARLESLGGMVARTKIAVGDETLEFTVDGRKVRVISRPADGQPARLFEFGASPTWADSSPMSDDDVVAVARGLIEQAGIKGEQAEVLGVPPVAAMSFPDDAHIYVSRVEPLSFTLPGSPTALILQMDERGDGHVWALGDARTKLGSSGMWWILNSLIDALTYPAAACLQARILTLGSTLGGPATQATIECGKWGIGVVWRDLRSGVVGDILAVQEMSYERVEGWLNLLMPLRDDLVRRRVHRQRLRPARTAEKWAVALERWSLPIASCA